MQFDPNNKIIKLCGEGMLLEGEGKPLEALQLFQQAWAGSFNNFERSISAHYVARHQESVADKLKWDELALQSALKVQDQNIKGMLPSLYLNIAKCHEDLKDFELARENYQEALYYTDYLDNDEYGNMIKSGISNGLGRIIQ